MNLQISSFDKTKNLFAEIGFQQYWPTKDLHNIRIRPRELLRWIDFFKTDLDYIVLVDLIASNNEVELHGEQFDLELVYILFNMNSYERVAIHVNFNSDENIPSLIQVFSHAHWYELDQSRKFKISFVNEFGSAYQQQETKLTFSQPKIRYNPNKSEAPYPEESWIWKEYDIFSELTMGLFALQVCFDPFKVVDLNVQSGFYEKGVETILQSKSWNHTGKLIDPLINSSSPNFSMIWYKVIEDLSNIKIPERAQALRIMMLELCRIVEHLTVQSEMLKILKYDQFKYFLDAREKLLELIEKFSGHRWGLFSFKLGGVADDLPMGWIAEYQSISKVILKNLKLIHHSLICSQDFKKHLNGSGVDARTILNWGVSGPAMRAAGLNFDLRKSKPFYFYKDIDFDVPVGIYGTSYDRYLIRFEEIYQSFRILTQVLDNLPLGDFNISQEWLQQNLVNSKTNFKTSEWVYNSIEGSNGETGLLIYVSNEFSPQRIKIKSSSFAITQALKEFLKGLTENEIRVAITSLGLRKSELDR